MLGAACVETGLESSDRLRRCSTLFEDSCIVTESVRHGIDVRVSVKGLSEEASDHAASRGAEAAVHRSSGENENVICRNHDDVVSGRGRECRRAGRRARLAGVRRSEMQPVLATLTT